MKLKVIRTTGKDSQVSVDDGAFNQPNIQLLAQAVRIYLSNQRQGTSKTQTRSEVNRTTRKWYAQKGTGNARHGARSAHIFVGGGSAHGPTGRENWKKTLSKKLKKKALSAALSAQVENVAVNDEVEELKGKTKQAYQLLKKIVSKMSDKNEQDFNKCKLLLVIDKNYDLLMRAVKNLPKVRVLKANLLNTLAVAQADKIVMTSKALEIIQNRVN
ncbi:MAG: 50S ribosomal protein L4 [Patescibacteria group bacterium]|nr:50S ribosomal protein L4 [Patescibacteria group bacterium]